LRRKTKEAAALFTVELPARLQEAFGVTSYTKLPNRMLLKYRYQVQVLALSTYIVRKLITATLMEAQLTVKIDTKFFEKIVYRMPIGAFTLLV
jgi:hypothetical protein